MCSLQSISVPSSNTDGGAVFKTVRKVVHLKEAPAVRPEPTPLFTLSNGACLRYRYISRGDSECFRTYDTPRARKPHRADTILGLTTARLGPHGHSPESPLQLICADFDRLPSEFDTGSGPADWKRFRAYLTWELGGRAVVTGSRSDKAKAFFVVQVDGTKTQDTEITTKSGQYTLTSLLPVHLLSLVDLSHSAMFETFITQGMCTALREGLPGLARAGYLEYAYTPYAEKGGRPTTKAYRVYGGLIASDFRWFVGKSAKREAFIRTLLECPGLIGTDGFDLVQEKLANAVGAKIETVKSWLAVLIRQKLLVCTDPTWAKGRKAKTYKALNDLAVSLTAIHGEQTSRKGREPLPTVIRAHEWHATLWRASYRFTRTPGAFLEWVQTVPGYDRKDRQRMAEKAITQRIKYADMPLAVPIPGIGTLHVRRPDAYYAQTAT